VVISFLGIVFGTLLIVGGSFMTWRADSVLHLYSQTGWRFHNIVAGDGKISVALGTVCFIGLVFGALLRSRAPYAVSVVCSALLLALSIYELVFISTRTGVVSPGSGVFMLAGGSVVAVLCSLGGYFMVGEKAGAGGRPVPEIA
jgi:hypothetical protein